MAAATTLPKTVAEASSIEEAFERYSKTPGARHAMWGAGITLSKFKKRFGKAFDAQTTPSDAVSNLLSSLMEALRTQAQVAAPVAEVEADEPVQQGRTVQPDNLMQHPTNKMVWKLRMLALEAGIGTAYRQPLFRGQASELIGKCVAAGDDKTAIRRLLEV